MRDAEAVASGCFFDTAGEMRFRYAEYNAAQFTCDGQVIPLRRAEKFLERIQITAGKEVRAVDAQDFFVDLMFVVLQKALIGRNYHE